MLRYKALVLMAVVGSLTMTIPAFSGDTYKVLRWFSGKDGGNPYGGLIFDASGNLYGTTLAGGISGNGTVFQLVPDGSGGWTEHVLHKFCSERSCKDGSTPYDNLIMDSLGNLYGTTYFGGLRYGGVVFQLKPNSNGTWTEHVLYTFCTICRDPKVGANPGSGLTLDKAGNLYGTTSAAVFQLVPGPKDTWKMNVLYRFCSQPGCADGVGPSSDLLLDSSGNLYGETAGGGTYSNGNCSAFINETCGTVFELSPGGGGSWTERVLHSFDYQDGYYPGGGLVFDEAGNLYGTTARGDAFGSGVVFQLVPGAGGVWTEKVIHYFDSRTHLPVGPLAFDRAGNLYGVTLAGGSGDVGTVFRLSPGQNNSWTQTVLHSFTGEGGRYPGSGVILDNNGNLYGATQGGGSGRYGHGLVYEITP